MTCVGEVGTQHGEGEEKGKIVGNHCPTVGLDSSRELNVKVVTVCEGVGEPSYDVDGVSQDVVENVVVSDEDEEMGAVVAGDLHHPPCAEGYRTPAVLLSVPRLRCCK